MSGRKTGSSMGDQILKAVDEILENGNFDKLNSVVSDTVSKALDETKRQLEQIAGNAVKYTEGGKSVSTAGHKTKNVVTKEPGKVTEYKEKKRLQRVGAVSGVLYRVFGGIGTGIFGLLFIIRGLSNISESRHWMSLVFNGILLAISMGLIWKGVGQSKRLKRAERYMQVMQGKAYMNLQELALLTNKSVAYVRRDLKYMLQKGFFPQGHLDQQEQCLILGDVAYREYLRLEKSRKEMQIEAASQKRLQEEEAELIEQSAEQEAQKELQLMVEEGNAYITQLRALNDAMEGEVISGKLLRLEHLLQMIFEQLKKQPEQMDEMHKFMEYYLPTTLKLVTAYEEFDRIDVAGADILSAKTEIEKTLDTINEAFAELLNKLFRIKAFDASADAQVLQTMLEREGLTGNTVFGK